MNPESEMMELIESKSMGQIRIHFFDSESPFSQQLKARLEEDFLSGKYFVTDSKRAAFLLLSLVFGGPESPDKLHEILGNFLPLNHYIKLKEEIKNNFVWETNVLAMNLFTNHIQMLKKQTKFKDYLFDQILPKITDDIGEKLFQFVCQEKYLHGVKIRCISEKYPLKKFKRKYEKEECCHLDGHSYLIIFQKNQQFKVGMIRTSQNKEEIIKSHSDILIKSKSSLKKSRIKKEIKNIAAQKQKKEANPANYCAKCCHDCQLI